MSPRSESSDATAVANELPPIVMVHGMWCTGQVWDAFRQPFERAGYAVHAPDLRHHAPGPAHPDLGHTSLRDYVDDLAAFIATLPRRPILIGHSMGGLLVQLLAARGLADSAVLICSAPPRGVFPMRLTMLPGTARMFSLPGFWKRPSRPLAWEARWLVFNRLSRAAAAAPYAQMVYESGRAGSEISFAFALPRGPATLNFDASATPLLSLAAEHDRLTPPSVCRANAQLYGPRCIYRVYPGHGHWMLGEPGWERVAADVLDWLGRQ